MTTPIEAYNLRDLGFLTYYAPNIATVASALSGSSSFSVSDLSRIIATPLVEEFHDRYETIRNTAVQYAADAYIRTLSDQDLQNSYALISSGSIVLPQVPTNGQKLDNPIVIDVGMGNIQLYTAVNLLNDYIAANPSSDPLGIKQYSGNIKGMALDLMDPTSGATAAFAGLMVMQAEQWFSTHAANWSSLDVDQKTALISAFYNRGEDWFQNEYDLWVNSGDGSYEPNPYSTPEGEEFRINNAAISAALSASTTDWSPTTWNLESTYIAPCFAAGTPILLADGCNGAIEDIAPGMRVAAFDEADAAGTGPLGHGRVTRLIPGLTEEWIVLDDGTRVTPGHRYLCPPSDAREPDDAATFAPIDAASNDNASAGEMRVARAGGV